jgi:hypothetical protein
VRTEAHDYEAGIIRLSIDQNEVGPKVAIPMITPLAGKCMIEVAMWQQLVGGKEFDNLHEEAVEPPPVPAGLLPPIDALAPFGVNRDASPPPNRRVLLITKVVRPT